MDTDDRRMESQARSDRPDDGSGSEGEGGSGPVVGIPLADALPSIEELDALAKRQSGKTLHQWDEVTRANRSRAVRTGRIRSDRPLTIGLMRYWISTYGFEPDDFHAAQVSVAAIRNFENGFQPATFQGRTAHAVIRHFLRPDVIPT